MFFVCYREWMAWICLIFVTLLPWLSLLLSLPAMLCSRMAIFCPRWVELGTPVLVDLRLQCPLPQPPWRAKLAVGRELTGSGWLLRPGDPMPTNHCGKLECSAVDGRVYDYLGLFSRRLKLPKNFDLTVRPVPQNDQKPGPGHPAHVLRWRAKHGGGYSENYDLRLYRPGDSIQHIHWKLSGKTGKLLLREPLEPAQAPELYLCLQGDADALDRKLGVALYHALQILQQEMPLHLVVTGLQGTERWNIQDKSSLWIAMDTVLSRRTLQEGGGEK